MTPRGLAIAGMLGGAVMISTAAPWVRVAEVEPSVSAFYRMAIGAVGLLLYCLMRKRTIWAGWRYSLRFVPVAVFFALDLYFWHRSIIYIGPGLATILANFQVFVLSLVGWLIYREQVGIGFAVGVLAAMAGVWLLVGVDWSALGLQYHLGVWFGLATAVVYSAFILGMRSAQSVAGALSPPANLAIMSVICAVLLFALCMIEGQSLSIPNLRTGAALVVYGLFCQVIGWVLITRAMPHLPAAMVGVVLLLQPSLSFLWDIAFFDRPTSGFDLVGVALVLIGIFIANFSTRPDLPREG